MKLEKIIECNKLLSALNSKKLPVSVGLVLSRNFKKLVPVMEDYENKRSVLIEKYAKRNEKGNFIENENGSVLIENSEDFIKEMNELTSVTINVVFDKISAESLMRCDDPQFDTLTVEEAGFIGEYMLET